MKKLLLATALALTTTFAFANPVDPFAEVKTLIQAKDQVGAFKALEKVAKTGHADAFYNLGYLTEMGQGTAKNDKKALKYYQQAAKKGSSLANFVLAKSYETGRLGLKANAKKAQNYLEAADRLGSPDATILIAEQLFAKHTAADSQTAQAKLRPLIAAGNVAAGYTLATHSINEGVRSQKVEQINQGLTELHRLGQQGHVSSLMLLGNLYASGSLVSQDLNKAKTIFTALDQAQVAQAKPALEIVNQALAAEAKKAQATPPASPKKIVSNNKAKKA